MLSRRMGSWLNSRGQFLAGPHQVGALARSLLPCIGGDLAKRGCQQFVTGRFNGVQYGAHEGQLLTELATCPAGRNRDSSSESRAAAAALRPDAIPPASPTTRDYYSPEMTTLALVFHVPSRSGRRPRLSWRTKVGRRPPGNVVDQAVDGRPVTLRSSSAPGSA